MTRKTMKSKFTTISVHRDILARIRAIGTSRDIKTYAVPAILLRAWDSLDVEQQETFFAPSKSPATVRDALKHRSDVKTLKQLNSWKKPHEIS